VSYDHGLPVLLEPSGSTVLLDRGPTDDVSGFHPTVRADAARPLVAYAFLVDGVVTVKVYDLDRRRVVAASTVPCREGCSDVSVDGLDSGTVFVSNHDGTRAWDYRSDQWSLVAGRGTVVADVRNRVVLYAGDPPTSPVDGWRWVHGAIDAQLSFDGRYVLDWSSVLEPTDPAGRPVTLAEGPRRPGYAFFAFDTDGSVLVSVGPRTSGEDFPVYDCPLSGEPCDELAPLPPGGGDPLFIGHDI
jgi:hypothetical protein